MSSAGLLLPRRSEASSCGRVRTGGLVGRPAGARDLLSEASPPVGAPSEPPGGRVPFSLRPTHHGPELLTLGLEAAGGVPEPLLTCSQQPSPAGASSPPASPWGQPPSCPLPASLRPRSSHKPPCSRTSVPQVSHGLLLRFSGSPNPSLPRCPPQVEWGRARIQHESEQDRGDRRWGCPGGEDGPRKLCPPLRLSQRSLDNEVLAPAEWALVPG